ncbi:MAG: hypothetical protein U0K93_00780 [Acutalibacteraceae bacterium]|nr:hypothetical protein [Acutalibacteraceae bacterium]
MFKIKRFGIPYNPSREKRQRNKIKRQIILILFTFSLTAIGITIAIAKIIQNNIACISVENELNSLWIGSLASYLGGTIGGIFSGVLAFLGVFYTIKYYKDADEKKEKNSIQPFLWITKGTLMNPINRFDLDNSSREEKISVNVTIKNIGNGFASILVLRTVYNFGGIAYNKVICPNEEDYISIRVSEETLTDGVAFSVQYIDAIRNEYIQEYNIKKVDNNIEVDCGYPLFLEQI